MSDVPPADRSATLEPGMRRPVTPLDLVRVVVLLGALATFALWGLSAWTFPLSLVFAIGLPALALLLWALFVSPRAVVRVHPFVRVFIELLIFVAATLAWWSMGQSVVGTAFAVVAVLSGVISGRRSLR